MPCVQADMSGAFGLKERRQRPFLTGMTRGADPGTRQKVERLKAQVRSGTFRIDPRAIAERLLRDAELGHPAAVRPRLTSIAGGATRNPRPR